MHVDDDTFSQTATGTQPPATQRPCSGKARHGRFLLAVLAALATGFLAGPAEAGSWFVNQARFHASVHASLGCADCHGDIAPGKDHPNPADVTKPLAAFFRADTCTGCHADVDDALRKGLHAGKPVVAGWDYTLCLRCHDPHYQTAKNHPKDFNPAKPVERQCGACHEKRDALPTLAKADAACMHCHQELSASAPGRRADIDAFCLRCHGDTRLEGAAARLGMPTMNKNAQTAATHKKLACLDCHADGARFPHDKQQRLACTTCHTRHDARVIHDVHATVTCEACHLSGITPEKDKTTGLLVARLDKNEPAGSLAVHAMKLPAGETSCTRCHTPGNTLGAAAMVLPAKSLLCLPCHAATFTVADTTSRLSLLVFLAGMAFLAVSWFFTAGLGATAFGHARNAGLPRKAIDWLGLWQTAFYDIFLQRRLYRQSHRRWAIHALIFFPFVFRFLWGLVGLLGSLWTPRSALPWWLLDTNTPVGAFLFDASGLALLAGLVLAAVSWLRRRAEEADASGLPRRDWPALILLTALVAVGFVLEGLRIAMTGFPAGSAYAFLGATVARAFHGIPQTGLSAAYGPVWYAHAILTGLVVAAIPFSQLRHMLLAPLAMLLEALGKKK